ncbi:TPA: tautomerase family protein [Morganella morganii]|nr:tautomerase family protein [Morganella morganii]
MVLEDTELVFSRSDNIILIRIYTNPYRVEQNLTLMTKLTEVLKQHCKISGKDLIIIFIINTKDNLSFDFRFA